MLLHSNTSRYTRYRLSILVCPSPAIAAGTTEWLSRHKATAGQFKAFPDIGDACSEKIIKGRPYAGKDKVAEEKISPRATYKEIKYKIVTNRNESSEQAPWLTPLGNDC